jgi:tetratricopeptide (TPR) repeat protein
MFDPQWRSGMAENDILTLSVSTLALIVSVASIFITYRQQKKELRTTIRDQITGVVQQLISTRAEMMLQQAISFEKRDSVYSTRIETINMKLTSLARQACALDNLQPDVGFDIEFIAIASSLSSSGDYPLAETYFEKAVNKSPGPYYKTINLSLYASFLFERYRHMDARKTYNNALSILDNTTDFNKWANGCIYRSWFIAEVWNLPSPHGEAEKCYQSAETLFRSISAVGMREGAIADLQMLRSISPLGTPIPGNLPPASLAPAAS